MKRRVKELGALAGFEKSGHYFLAGDLGRGYDCGMRVAVEVCKMMDRNPDMKMSDLRRALPVTYSSPTMSPYAADTEKYAILERIVERLKPLTEFAGRPVKEVVTVNGARVILDNGSWGLVRASSNTPNLVVVCESSESDAELRAIFHAIDAVIRTEPAVGDYDQTL
jgi:phosphomannomutase/phosphoglucomutase